MAGVVMNQPSFDYFFMSQSEAQSTPDLYSSPDFYSQQAVDFSTDSPTSPDSPVSPIFGAANPYSLPSDDWMAWEDSDTTANGALDLDIFPIKAEPQPFGSGSPVLSRNKLLNNNLNSVRRSINNTSNSNNLSLSPAINPMDLSNRLPSTATSTGQDGAMDVPFGRDGLNDTRPLFVLPPPAGMGVSSAPSSRADAAQYHAAATGSMSGIDAGRYPSRKRKSSTSAQLASAAADSSSRRLQSSPSSSPSPPPPERSNGGKSSSSSGATTASSTGRPKKKTAHNMIEKRYRTNLNDKLAALRDSVPSLRAQLAAAQAGNPAAADGGELDGEEDDGANGAAAKDNALKLNKATVLSKATEYIAQLERRNRGLARENEALRGRVDGLERVVRRGDDRTGW